MSTAALARINRTAAADNDAGTKIIAAIAAFVPAEAIAGATAISSVLATTDDKGVASWGDHLTLGRILLFATVLVIPFLYLQGLGDVQRISKDTIQILIGIIAYAVWLGLLPLSPYAEWIHSDVAERSAIGGFTALVLGVIANQYRIKSGDRD